MSRIRTIKPEFFKHEDIFDAEQETQLPLRIAFAALWTCCDREGRFKWKPRTLKADCLPFDDVDFSRVLDALTTRGFVVKYEVSGNLYGYVPSFTRHQVINNRENKSILPEPTENNTLIDACLTRAARVGDAASGERKGKERKGKDIYPPKSDDCDKPKIEYTEDFECWYKIYPRHEGKADGLKAYKAARKTHTDDFLLQQCQLYAASCVGKEKKYIPLPASWIRGKRWEDETQNILQSDPDDIDGFLAKLEREKDSFR